MLGDIQVTTKGIRKPQRALSPRFVETVTEPGKHFDGQGLFLRVQPNGAKQWVQRITIRVTPPAGASSALQVIKSNIKQTETVNETP